MIYPKLSGPIGPQCPYLWAISGDIAGDIILPVDTLIRESVSTDSFLIEVDFYSSHFLFMESPPEIKLCTRPLDIVLLSGTDI